MSQRIRFNIALLLTVVFYALLFILTSCGGGSGEDDQMYSDNVSHTTNCVQEITINVDSPDAVQPGDEVQDGYIDTITKVESNEQGVDITATVCSSEDNDSASTNVQGEVDVEASLLPR